MSRARCLRARRSIQGRVEARLTESPSLGLRRQGPAELCTDRADPLIARSLNPQVSIAGHATAARRREMPCAAAALFIHLGARLAPFFSPGAVTRKRKRIRRAVTRIRAGDHYLPFNEFMGGLQS